jgi:uncharacterized protein (TIGR03663 family)
LSSPLQFLSRHLPLALVALVALAALWLRTTDLARRPMHADEANQAVKLGRLIETGRYEFDPRDHHGPTLYYCALVPAWLRGQTTLATLTETTARLTPALFGVAVVLLTAALAAPLGRWLALIAAALIALSPPAVYYSRYFIQETLLVAFTLGALVCGQRWWTRRQLGWALATGTCAGLMLATKASAVFFGLAALAAIAIAGRGSRRPPFVAAALVTAAFVAALFYSAFLTHPAGLRDALAGLATMTGRATGGGPHDKPWWYYAGLFTFQRNGGYLWDESLFALAAAAGTWLAWRSPRRLPRVIALFTVTVAVVLSLTPYKTPWIVINLIPGIAILAAIALAALAAFSRWGRIGATLLLVGLVGESVWQTRQAAFRLPADPRSPFAYVHSSPDVLKVRPLADAALARHPGGVVKVVSEEYWPLPWYLRHLANVGYWNTPPADCDAALVISSASLAAEVRPRLHGLYRESFLGLRPGFLFVVFTPDTNVP